VTDRATPAHRHPPTWLLHGGRPLSRWLIRRRYDVREHGTAHVPPQGPVIVAANHTGVIDGPLLAIFGPRPVHALTKEEMFDGRLGAVPAQPAGQIALGPATPPTGARSGPASTCSSTAERSGIFPEGNRGAGRPGPLPQRRGVPRAWSPALRSCPLMMFGTRPAGGGKDAMPEPWRGARPRVRRADPRCSARPWPRTSGLVADTSAALHARMLDERGQRSCS
jgi:1-acyl-sn-glycerol-3-phosphate acyltransferase